jgi:hypothetical protein
VKACLEIQALRPTVNINGGLAALLGVERWLAYR